jgi:hypothetical protein
MLGQDLKYYCGHVKRRGEKPEEKKRGTESSSENIKDNVRCNHRSRVVCTPGSRV